MSFEVVFSVSKKCRHISVVRLFYVDFVVPSFFAGVIADLFVIFALLVGAIFVVYFVAVGVLIQARSIVLSLRNGGINYRKIPVTN